MKKMKIDYQKLMEDFKLQAGKDTATAVLNLASMPGTAQANIVKCTVLALGFYVGMVGLLIFLSASWLLIFIALLGGFVAAVALSITGSLKLIAEDILTEVSKMLIGLLQPVEELYAFYEKNSVEKVAKDQFVTKFLKEHVVPLILKKLPAKFFKGKLEKIMLTLVDQIGNTLVEKSVEKTEKLLEKPKQAGLAIVSKLKVEDQAFTQNMKASIEDKTIVLKKQSSAPFFKTLKAASIGWGVIWSIHLITFV